MHGPALVDIEDFRNLFSGGHHVHGIATQTTVVQRRGNHWLHAWDAVGDALGLPYEGVSRDRAPRLLGPLTRHRFLFGCGMISDDTEHTLMVAQSLIESSDDVDEFARRFAWRLRWWILALPAGVGKATARSGIKLWLGASAANAGVFSAARRKTYWTDRPNDRRTEVTPGVAGAT